MDNVEIRIQIKTKLSEVIPFIILLTTIPNSDVNVVFNGIIIVNIIDAIINTSVNAINIIKLNVGKFFNLT